MNAANCTWAGRHPHRFTPLFQYTFGKPHCVGWKGEARCGQVNSNATVMQQCLRLNMRMRSGKNTEDVLCRVPLPPERGNSHRLDNCCSPHRLDNRCTPHGLDGIGVGNHRHGSRHCGLVPYAKSAHGHYSPSQERSRSNYQHTHASLAAATPAVRMANRMCCHRSNRGNREAPLYLRRTSARK